MKKYVRLSVDETAFYSGSTYEEEVFLPLEVWKEIEGNFRDYMFIHGLDGKHSEVKADIDILVFNEKDLEMYLLGTNDGEKLLEHVYEYLDIDEYGYSYLENIQTEVARYNKVETLTIKIRKDQKEEVLNLLKDYLI